MGNSVMKKLAITLLFFVMAIVCGGLFGCSKIDDETDDTDATTVSVARVALSTTNAFVKSDNSDSITITAMALDENNGLVSDVVIQLASTAGALGTSILTTGENGTGQTTFSAGTLDPSNQTATITATASGARQYMLPIQIVGTELSITAQPSLQIGLAETDELEVKVLDAGDNPVYNADVTFTVASSSTGSVTLSSSSATTDINGLASITVTAATAGDVTIEASSSGASVTHTYTVDSQGGGFYISNPTGETASLTIGGTRSITVNAPSQSTVMFATTLGTFVANGESVINVAVSSGIATAVLTSSNSGIASVEVYDADDLTTKDSVTIAVSASAANAAKLSLQSSSSNVAPSITGSTENSVTLTATVKTDDDEPVGGAAVAFSISNSTGGGEYVSPVVVWTNSSGIAESVFTSGSLSSGSGQDGGVNITASVIGSSPLISYTIPVVIGGTAGSIIISQSTKIYSINNDTTYELPMSVMVADSNGNPIAGARVSLSIWPIKYYTGVWPSTDLSPTYSGQYDNEDQNRNLTLDTIPDEDTNNDGQLTPFNSAAGTVPTYVTTDENGVGEFSLVYGKTYAGWIDDEFVASTQVLGSETRSTTEISLSWASGDEPYLPYTSPFGATGP